MDTDAIFHELVKHEQNLVRIKDKNYDLEQEVLRLKDLNTGLKQEVDDLKVIRALLNHKLAIKGES